MNNIALKTPSIDELNYRKKWLSDSDTMSYNRGLDLNINGYNKIDGTINISDNESEDWYYKWTNNDRYYAYIYLDNKPIGEVYYYPDNGYYSMGILIYSKYRNKGYSKLAITELLRIAFEENKIDELRDSITIDRSNIIDLFLSLGFKKNNKKTYTKVFNKKVEVIQVIMTKSEYFMLK